MQLPLNVPRGWAAGPAAALDDCRVVLVFCQLLLGVVLPCLFVAAFPLAAEPMAARAADRRRPARPKELHLVVRLWRAAGAAQHRAVATLCDLLRGGAGDGPAAAVLAATAWLHLLSLLWVAAMTLEAPGGVP